MLAVTLALLAWPIAPASAYEKDAARIIIYWVPHRYPKS